MLTRVLLATALVAGSGSQLAAQTIYPIDRAEILAGARFGLEVEFPGAPAADAVIAPRTRTTSTTPRSRPSPKW